YAERVTRRISGLVERRLLPVIRRRLSDVPVTVLAGHRAIGKSTLLRRLAADAKAGVLDLDDLDTRAAVSSDPALFGSGPGPGLGYEVQHVSALLDAVKAELVGELLKQLSWHDDVVTAGHWRTHDGLEVDAVFERSDGSVAGLEIKSGSRVDARGANAL